MASHALIAFLVFTATTGGNHVFAALWRTVTLDLGSATTASVPMFGSQ